MFLITATASSGMCISGKLVFALVVFAQIVKQIEENCKA